MLYVNLIVVFVMGGCAGFALCIVLLQSRMTTKQSDARRVRRMRREAAEAELRG